MLKHTRYDKQEAEKVERVSQVKDKAKRYIVNEEKRKFKEQYREMVQKREQDKRRNAEK